MPRKAATPSEPTERRVSSRIASQPKKEPEPPKAAKAAPAPKKRKPEAEEKSAETKNGDSDSGDSEAKKSKKETNGGSAPSAEAEEAAPAKSEKQLKVGDALPTDLVLSDEEGKEIKIADVKKAVLFMYPKANTGGCTKQAQCYRDEYPSWERLGFAVYGLSADNVTPLKNWKEKYSFPYKLISDPQRKLIAPLTGTSSKTIRSHVVVDSQGKLADVQLNISPGDSSKKALEAAEKAS